MTSMHHCMLWSAEDVAVRFLESLAVGDAEIARHLLAPDVRYRFAGVWVGRGREQVSQVLQRVAGGHGHFDVAIHDVAADHPDVPARAEAVDVVRTLRTDHLRVGLMHLQFAVRGMARIRDGKIAAWEDSVDAGVMASALGRGLLGTVVPGVRPHLPRT